jgi:Leucine-rich repeat (LRR) protein
VLTDNLFSGSIPAELGGLQKLQLFSCARSRKPGPRLSGTLPALDRLPALTSLYLNHNDISGSIPSTFISASPLASFVFLGDNFLSDAVPLELDSIPAVYLQLEENHISGFPNQFCNNSHWMGGSLGRVGCDAFLCPPGTASPIGRANDTVTCESCSSSDAARYYGSTSCDAVSSEQKILLRLYQRCGGIEWYQKDGWAADSKGICEWYGVTCHADGHVKSIDLSANNLVNQPPWEIFELPRLESLVLSSNPIVDFSFVGIERARRLTELRLDAIGLSSLEGLEQGVGLTKLNLRFNNLQGAFPTEILALKNLRELNLADNRIESQLPSFSDLTRLQTLRLGSNGFTGPLPSFNDMVVLTTIDLSFNRLSGSIPEDFLNRLSSSAKVHVDLASNQLTGGLPQDLHRFETMTIYLRDNRINELSDEFCEKSKWNGGDVDHFGCNAILCPPGTATAIGRQSMARIESPCARCENRNFEYYGMTDCEPESSSASTVGTRNNFLLGIVASCVVFTAAYLL